MQLTAIVDLQRGASRFAVAVMAIFFGVSISACSRVNKVEAEEPKASDVPAVAVSRAAVEKVGRTITLTAEFKPYQEIDVLAKVAGFVKSIDVDLGDQVKQGQLLAVLEVPEMDDDRVRAQSMLSRSEAEVSRAKDELQRAESAHDIAHVSYGRLSDVAKQRKGLIAQQEIDDAKGKDLVAEAQVNAAKSNLASMEQQVQVSSAELQKSRTLLDYTKVTAPFEGVVTRRYADLGSMIQAGTSSSTQAMPLVKISQIRLLRLILPVPESAVPAVRVGQDVAVRVPTLNQTFHGRVARLAEKVSSSTRTMDTEVDVQNPSMALVPGMFAEVGLTVVQPRAALTIPISCIDVSSDGNTGQVVVVTSENRIEIRKIELGLQTETNFEVKSGLKEGELAVSGNRSGLLAGELVRPRISESAKLPTS